MQHVSAWWGFCLQKRRIHPPFSLLLLCEGHYKYTRLRSFSEFQHCGATKPSNGCSYFFWQNKFNLNHLIWFRKVLWSLPIECLQSCYFLLHRGGANAILDKKDSGKPSRPTTLCHVVNPSQQPFDNCNISVFGESLSYYSVNNH